MTAIEQIRKELDAATPGPWFTELDGVYNANRMYLVTPTGDSDQDRADATLIAHAPTYLAALLDVVEAAQEWDRVWKPPVARAEQAMTGWKLQGALARLNDLLPQKSSEGEL